MSTELIVGGLEKRFGAARPAVDDVSFTVAAGEIVVLLGPSGCGKTTTLRCVAGLEQPSGGEIQIGGQTVNAPARGVFVPARQRNIGMVFQSYAVWPHMTVRQNVAYPLRHRSGTSAEKAARILAALELVELAAYADRPVVSLSGGQMQRVALARSMVYEPRLLLLDEPLSNLDALLRLRLRDDLRRIIKKAGLTALYVTHDQTEAVALGDRIGVMQHGRLHQLATPRTLYNRPADLFVAGFTGASNTLHGRVVDAGGFVVIAGHTVRAWFPTKLDVGTPVTVALRPENIRLTPAADDVNRFPARVLAQRYQGMQTAYDLEAFGTTIEVIEIGTAPRNAVGDVIDIVIPPDACWAYRTEEQR